MELIDQENEDNAEWLLHILKQVQLEQFYVRIRDHLQISRITHFDYVTPDDLEKVRKDITMQCCRKVKNIEGASSNRWG